MGAFGGQRGILEAQPVVQLAQFQPARRVFGGVGDQPLVIARRKVVARLHALDRVAESMEVAREQQ